MVVLHAVFEWFVCLQGVKTGKKEVFDRFGGINLYFLENFQ